MTNIRYLEQTEAASSRRVRFNSTDVSRSRGDLTVNDRDSWLAAVRKRLTILLSLPTGWDGYGAPKIATETALFTLQVLQDIWQPASKAPAISPLSSGGLMVEWAAAGRDLVLEIERPYSMIMLYDEGNETVECPVGPDITKVQRHIESLFHDALPAPMAA